jgi:hypothetical protein
VLRYVLVIFVTPSGLTVDNHSLRITGQYLEDRVSEDRRGSARSRRHIPLDSNFLCSDDLNCIFSLKWLQFIGVGSRDA